MGQSGGAFKGLQTTMASIRSAAQRGEVTLPPGPGEPELAGPEKTLS